ncbi:MAG TPA: helix-turn-helix domain-containing protein [Pseudonocardia sp.]|jgi:hypothetical protein
MCVDDPDPSLAGLVPALIDRLPVLLDEVRLALEEDWPDYARFLAANSAEVGVAADAALNRLVTLVTTSGADGGVEGELFEEIGRIQWRQGSDLTTLLSAYQMGARVFWRHVSAVAVEQRVEPRTVAALAEAVFLFVDKLSSSSARGYVLEQSEAAVTRERLREELVGLLLSDRADQAAVLAAAERAEWPLPDEMAVVLVEPDSPASHQALARLDPSNIVFSRPPLLGAIVPNPSRRNLRRLATVLRGTRAVVGVAVPADRLPASLHIAETAARLQRSGVLVDDPVFTADHLDAIIVHRDAGLLDALRTRVLGPLATSSPASRERLSETLLAWLRHMGDRRAIAAELHVHPQTVRYRLAKLHELFGEDLDSPSTRAQLVLALAWGPPQPVRSAAGVMPPGPVGQPPGPDVTAPRR